MSITQEQFEALNPGDLIEAAYEGNVVEVVTGASADYVEARERSFGSPVLRWYRHEIHGLVAQ